MSHANQMGTQIQIRLQKRLASLWYLKLYQLQNNVIIIITNQFVRSKKRNHEFSNSPIYELKVLQNVF